VVSLDPNGGQENAQTINSSPAGHEVWPSEAALTGTISANFSKFGITITKLSYMELPRGGIPIIYASSPDPAVLSKVPASALFGTDSLAGFFIFLTNPDGTPADVIGNADIVSGGLGWSPNRSGSRLAAVNPKPSSTVPDCRPSTL
jgi:hypothetical protein